MAPSEKNCGKFNSRLTSKGDESYPKGWLGFRDDPECKELELSNPGEFEKWATKWCKGTRLHHPFCKRFCGGLDQKGNVSDELQYRTALCAPALDEFCESRTPTEENPYEEDKTICSCYYPQRVYDEFKEGLLSKVSGISGQIDTQRNCLYPACKDVTPGTGEKDGIPWKDYAACAAVNIASCVQDAGIDYTGANVSGATTELSQECKINFGGEGEGKVQEGPAEETDKEKEEVDLDFEPIPYLPPGTYHFPLETKKEYFNMAAEWGAGVL